MKKIKGNKIVNFLFYNNEFCLEEDFILELDKSKFRMEIDFTKYKNIKWNFRNIDEISKREYLHCIDNKGNQFTLFDCYICPLNMPCTKIEIVWNTLIYGAHVNDYDKYMVDKAIFKIDNKKYTYRLNIGKSNYYIENESIQVKTTWGKKQYNHRFDGVIIELVPKKAMLLSELIKSFNLLLEIYFLQIGYFPDIIDISFQVNKKIYYMINPNESIYCSKTSNVKLETRLFLDNSDYSIMYSNYKKLNEDNLPLFNMFYNNQGKTNNLLEVDTFVYIQCLESYYTTFNNSYTLFPDVKRKEISNSAIDILKDDYKFNQIIKSVYDNDEDFYNTLNGMLTNINRKSFNKIINDIFNNESVRLIFEYEVENGTMKKFINKIYRHRNFIAHINKDLNSRFIGKENKLAQEKIKLAFRLSVLNDIGAVIEEKQLKSCINDINRWYKTNKLS